MGQKIDRSKRTILFQHLPGQTFDFGRTGVISRVTHIRGTPNTELNLQLVLTAIEREVGAWSAKHRPLFAYRTSLIEKINSFVLMDPLSVSAEMFPLVFWCQGCNHVLDYTRRGSPPPSKTCPKCKRGKLVQFRFVRVHRCGALLALTPYCSKCKSNANMILDTRGSERISNFRWRCRKCNESYPILGGSCPECNWDTPLPQNDSGRNPKLMNVEVHRAGSTFYEHHVVLLNQPGRELSAFLELPEWPEVAAASYLEFPETSDKRLLDFTRYLSNTSDDPALEITEKQITGLRAKGFTDTQIEDFVKMQEQLKPIREIEVSMTEPANIAAALVERTGIDRNVWRQAGQEMLEAVLPIQSGNAKQLFDSRESIFTEAQKAARRIGFDKVTLISDFPMTYAFYGFSRVDYRPGRCYINPFPPDRDHNSKFPIFVDLIQADAIMLRLNADRVCRWLEFNGYSISLPSGTGNTEVLQQAYFADLFSDTQLRETIMSDKAVARMVFGLLHSLSHISVRQAALLCGLDRSSLSEYVLPRTLSFAIYSSHRFGATIGALTALFEQSLGEWLRQIMNSRTCVYDPVCVDQGGNCHACIHLPEMSCRFFNLNLGRSFLFGGPDPELDEIEIGYFDPSLT